MKRMYKPIALLLFALFLFSSCRTSGNIIVQTGTESRSMSTAGSTESTATTPGFLTTSSEKRVGVEGVRLSLSEVTLRVGQTCPIYAQVLPEEATDRGVSFELSDPSVARYEDGILTAFAPGQTTLTAVTHEDGYIARCFITILEDDPTESHVSTTTPLPTTTTPPVTTTPLPPTTTTPNEKTLVSSFSMLTAGDNLYHRGVMRDGQEHRRTDENEDFYFDFFYSDVKDQIANADYAVINQEAIVLPKKYLGNDIERYFRKDGSFVSPSEVYDTLARLGFDAVDMANNHVLDMGAGGMQWALDYLHTRNDMLFFGGYYDEADRANIRVAEINGIRVAFLGYTYGTNVSTEIASKEEGFRFLVPYIDDDKMIEELARANEIADFTVVFVHWGTEYSFEPNEEQRHAAKVLAENGAGIIIGHHTHTLQPIEYIDDGKGGQVLCAYSLGTLVSNMDTDRNMLAGFFSFDVSLYSDGSVSVTNPILTPTVFYYAMNYRASRLLYLKDLTPEMAASHGIGNYPSGSAQKNTMTVERLYEYLHNVIADEFLPDQYKV